MDFKQLLLVLCVFCMGHVSADGEVEALQDAYSQDDSAWVIQLLKNMLTYGVVLLPLYLAMKWGKPYVLTKINTFERLNLYERLLKSCVVGNEVDEERVAEGGGKVEVEILRRGRFDCFSFIERLPRWGLLAVCFCGLMGSYLTWGVLQEKIMTKSYDGVMFKKSQFLVFVNRILAFVFASLYVMLTNQPTLRAPLGKFSFPSLSNILSSWFQYEALKYVTFPTQVLAKSAKVIPVMIMGKIVLKKNYKNYDYLMAILISGGMMLFSISRIDDQQSSVSSTSASGALILAGYLTCDAFTSNYQSSLYKTYHMSSSQMMMGVNLFSVLLTFVSLCGQGSFWESVSFAMTHVNFMYDIFVLSICSALGQGFIYLTIQQFGAVNFTIIMTCRQIVAIILSCIIYQHAISATGLIGMFIVFFAVFFKIHLSRRGEKNVGVVKTADQIPVNK